MHLELLHVYLSGQRATMNKVKYHEAPFIDCNSTETTGIEKTKRPFTVIVEGNIGSGKSTFLEHFNTKTIVDVLTEPVEEWRNLCGHNILQLMYENPSRWSHLFQSYVQLTMTKHHVQPLSSNQVNVKVLC